MEEMVGDAKAKLPNCQMQMKAMKDEKKVVRLYKDRFISTKR